VLADGEEYTVKPLTKKELEKKISEKSFEGKLYRQIYELIQRNMEDIKKAEPETSKNSTGYYLWKVWNEENETFDLTKLIVGSQGTLCIVTEITFALITPKTQTAMLEVELENLDDLDKVVNDILTYKPESFECFDDQTLRFALHYITDIVKDFKKTTGLPVYAKFVPEFILAMTMGLPKLVLIAEFTGDDEALVLNKAKVAQTSLEKFPKAKTRVVHSNDEEKYWILRRDSFNILRNHSGKNLRTAPFIDDIVVKPEKLPLFLPKLQKTLSPYKGRIIYTIAGHIGNGNFHIIPLMDMNKKEIRDLIPEISQKVFDLVFQFDGSMAAEHNDGLARGMFLKKMYGEKVYTLMKTVKKVFDPHKVFNQQKKI
jgi:FAD/FMN-containing dehydrogenase